MLAQFFAMTLINTFSWFGGQGYCAYDFAILESGEELTNVSITLRPRFEPGKTATGKSELPDETMAFEVLGGSPVNSGATAKIETDCNIEGFDIVAAICSRDRRGKLWIGRCRDRHMSICYGQPVGGIETAPAGAR